VYIPGQSFNPYGAPPIMAENTPLPETVLFPTTAPTAPPIMGMRAPQVMPPQQVPAPAPVPTPAPTPTPTPAPVYDPVADMFVRGANKYVLDEKGNVVQVPQDTGFIPDTPGGMVSTLDPNLRNKAVSAGLSPENIAALAGDMRVPPSYTPPTAPTPLSAFRNPSENAALDWMSLDDQLGYFFSTNAANPADVKGNRSAFVPLDENAGYRLYDARTGQYVAEGVGAQGLQDVYSTAQNLSATGGTNADWRVEMRKPGSESWSTMARDKPKSDALGNILGDVALGAGVGLLGAATGGLGLAAAPAALAGGAAGGALSAAGANVTDIALPVAGAMIPGVGPVLGSTLGSAASSTAQGRSLEDTLLRAGLTAGTAGLMQGTGLGQDISSALGVGQSAAESAIAQKAAEQAGNILVERSVAPLIESGAGSLVSSVLPDLTGTQIDVPEVAPTENQIIVPGTRPSSTFAKAVEPVVSGVANALGPDVIPTTEGKPIIVSETRSTFDEAFSPEFMEGLVGATVGAGVPTTEGEPITVTGSPENLLPAEYAVIPAAGVGAATLTPGTAPSEGVLDEYTGLEGGEGGLLSGIDLSKLGLSDWLNIAGLGIGTIGGLVGGGGGGGLSTVPAGLFSSIGGGGGAFSSTLPAANMPGLTAPPGTAYARQDLSDVDWATYGERPEVAMFSYVPRPGEGPLPSAADAQNSIQPSAPPIMNEDEGAMARGGLVGYAAGGGVNGPGDGREDVIPAMLSDGEYVIDAETVALLGNGSSKAGADALDRFRVNLRKHKGKQLARGGFSNDAKSPMHYLNGAAG
jgi:hypothetical protein